MHRRKIGRIEIETYPDGSGTVLRLQAGWNESCDWLRFSASLEELHDLRYIVDRQIVFIEQNTAK